MYCTLPTATNPGDFIRRLRRVMSAAVSDVVVRYDGAHRTLCFTTSAFSGRRIVVGAHPRFLGQQVTFTEFLQELRES